MSNMEFNKIFAAVLVAGIIAMFSGFVADNIMHDHELEQDAVHVEGMEGSAGGGAAKAALPEPILQLIATADVAQGEKLSKVCAACHSFDSGGPNGVGPNLYGIVGAKYAHAGGFAYSETLAGMSGNWDYVALNKFIWKPKTFVEGTKMSFVGFKKPEDRAAIIAWLRTKAPSAAPLPSEAQIAAEAAELAPPAEETEEVSPAEGEAKPEEAHKG